MWQTEQRDWAFIYDGCSVRLFDSLEQEPAVFGGLRNVARAFVVDVRDYADPFPYFRTGVRWEREELQSVSIIGVRPIATWREHRFWSWRTREPYRRAEVAGDLGPMARNLLFVERFLPTEEEIAAAQGVEVPPPDRPEPDLVRDVMCPRGERESSPEHQ